MAPRTDKTTVGKFRNNPHTKDGYTVSDCKDARERRVLEFLVPILSPDRNNRMTIMLGNTIFGALSGDRKVDWGIAIRDYVAKLCRGVGKTKPSSICPFLYHLYYAQDCMRGREKQEYTVQEVKLAHGMRGDSDDEREESEREGKTSGLSKELEPERKKEVQKEKGKEKDPI